MITKITVSPAINQQNRKIYEKILWVWAEQFDCIVEKWDCNLSGQLWVATFPSDSMLLVLNQLSTDDDVICGTVTLTKTQTEIKVNCPHLHDIILRNPKRNASLIWVILSKVDEYIWRLLDFMCFYMRRSN